MDAALLLIQEGLRGVVRLPGGTAHALASSAFPIAVMGKTGTTNDFRDALFVGSTYGIKGITVAVRIGFDDNRSLGSGETGARLALPVFREVMMAVYREQLAGPVPSFPAPLETRITAYLQGRSTSFRGVTLPRLDDRERENSEPGQVDREYASLIREIACVDPATVRLSAPSAEGETKTDAGSIGAALIERAEELFDIPTRETAALVLNLDVHALGAGADPERDGGPRPGELEGVLQKVSHDRREDLSVSLDRHSFFDGHHRQSDATGVRLQCRGRCDFFDESSN
jgi:hypothetical protein